MSATYQGMKFPGAPQGLKMACGENPKRVYGGKDKFPSTRMGNVAGYRAQWIEAQEYIRDQQEYEKKVEEGDEDAEPVKRDARLDTLAAALKGEILVHQHCYRADEMATVLDMADEFGYRVSAFNHAAEAYKIANLLAEHGVCGACIPIRRRGYSASTRRPVRRWRTDGARSERRVRDCAGQAMRSRTGFRPKLRLRR